jgi:hypothetical protein
MEEAYQGRNNRMNGIGFPLLNRFCLWDCRSAISERVPEMGILIR